MKLNSRIQTIQESQTLRLNAKALELKRQGLKVINLTAGELDFSTPKNIQKAIAKKLAQNKYTPVPGLSELRQQIANLVKNKYQIKTTAQNIIVTAGAKQGLSEVLQTILNLGDEVIIPTPAWVSYEQQVKLSSGTPVFVPLTKTFDLDITAIKKRLTKRTKAIILNSPHNPTGAVFSKKSLRSLKNLLQKKPVFIISDEIYERLAFTNDYELPAKILKPNKKLVIINGFSKSHALTGWRIGYVAADPEIIGNMTKIQSHLSGNASIISQFAASAALRFPHTDYLQILKKRRRIAERLLIDIPKVSFTLPQGAFYFFLDIRKIDNNSQRFCDRLLDKNKVLLVPGEAFHAPGFVRLSFAATVGELKKALRSLKIFINNY